MKPPFRRLLPLGVTVLLSMTSSGLGADITKANNTTALNDPASWSVGAVPGTSDVALWNSTVTGANTVLLGGNLSWAGVKVTNPGGAVVVTHTAGQTLTLGASGIDLSTASQNLTLLNTTNTAGTIAIGTSQTWNVVSGRTLTLFGSSNAANQRLSGSGHIEIAGGGIVRVLTGDAGSTTFTAGNGNDTFSGTWTVTNGSLRGLRNGTHAWGTGAIILNGGTIGQEQGSWTWSNNITLNSGTTSTFDDFNASGTTRALKLQGVISGSGNVNFNDSNNRMDANNGFVLTGANTMSGTVNVGSNGNLRVGGVTGNDSTLSAGTGGTLGTAVVNLSANSTLTFSRSDAHTVANAISGAGVVNVGGGVSGATTQVVTLSGTNTYLGATQVNAGRLHLTGSLTSAITVASGASLSGTGSTSGLLTLSSGGGLALAGGLTTSSVTANGATFGGSNLVTFLSNPVPGAVYDLFTYGNGAVTTANNLSVAWRGSMANDTANKKYVFTAGSAGTRTWTAASGTWGQGSASTWSEGDNTFYGGDSVVFGEPASASTVTLSGRLAPASVLVNNSTNPYTFSGTDGTADITGGASLTKSGSGTLILNSAHSYSGTTTVSSGVVDVGNGGTTGSLGSGGVSVASGAELVLNRSNAFAVSNSLSGAGLLTKKGAGRLTVSGDNSVGSLNWNFTGTGNGDIGFNNASALGGSGSTITLAASATGSTFFATSGNSTDVGISIGTGGVFTWNGSTGNTTNLTGVISGSGAFTKVSGETLRLSGVNTYTGATTISGGTLELYGSGQLGSGSYNGNISNAATLWVNTSADQTLSGVISGAGSLTKANIGKLVLSADNTFTGSVTINGGTVEVPSNGLYRDGAGAAVYNGSAVVTIGAGGTLKLVSYAYNGAGGLGGLRDYANARVINGGTLEVTGAGHSSGQDFTIGASGGTFRYNPSNTGDTLTLSGNVNSNTTLNGALVFDAIGNITAGDVIAGSGSLGKTGSGKLILSGTNSYTGATSATAGSLIINGSTSTSSLVTIGSAATLGGSGTVGGDTAVSGVLAPGNSPGLLTFTNDLSFAAGSTVLWELSANSLSGRGTVWDAVNVGGDLAFTGATTLQPVFNAAGSTVDFNDLVWAQALGLSAGWKVFEVTGSISGLANLAVASGDFVDSQGNLLSSVRPGLSMLLYQSNGGIYLTTVSAIPEPTALFGLAGLLAGGCLVRRRGV
jgi:fibronectin-binding autotransporter adhesin